MKTTLRAPGSRSQLSDRLLLDRGSPPQRWAEHEPNMPDAGPDRPVSHLDIQVAAYYIYQRRIDCGHPGNAQSDWELAERLLHHWKY